MFCSQFDPNLTQIPWTRTWCFKRSEEIFVGINLLTFMRAKPQEWLKFLNVCDDIDLKYQCLSNKMEQYLKSMNPGLSGLKNVIHTSLLLNSVYQSNQKNTI